MNNDPSDKPQSIQQRLSKMLNHQSGHSTRYYVTHDDRIIKDTAEDALVNDPKGGNRS